VTVDIASSNTDEAVVDTTSFVFTPFDWATPLTITITGVDDPFIDGAAAYTVNVTAASSDGRFDGLTESIAAINLDDDFMGNEVAWWRLDDGWGLRALDSLGVNHGTLEEMDGSEWTAGQDVGGLEFGGLKGYVETTPAPGSSQDLSVAFWMKADILKNQFVIEKTPEDPSATGWGVWFDNVGDMFFRVGSTEDYTDVASSVSPAYVPGTWLHVGATVFDSGGNRTVTLYLDGVAQAGVVAGQAVDDNTVPLWIGASREPGSGISEPSPTGLLVHWMFDEGSGGVATDASGNGNDGVITGATWDTGNIGTGALRFAADADLVEDADGENFINGLDAITFCAWVKADAIGVDRGFFRTQGSRANSDGYQNMRYDSTGANGGGTNVMKVGVRVGGAARTLESSAMVQTTEWQHVAVTWSSGEVNRLYINGVLDVPTNNAGAVAGVIDGAATLVVGNGPFGGWRGLVDDFRIYGRVLNGAEIAMLASIAIPTDPSLLVHYRLDETAAGAVVDSSGNANDGTNNGATINQPGQIDTAYSFDGSNDYIALPNLGLSGNVSVSFAAWVNITSAGNENIFGFGTNGTNNTVFSLRTNGATQFHLYFWNNDLSVNVPAHVGTWVHVAAVWDAATTTQYIYFNGAEMGQRVASAPNFADTNYRIGGFNNEYMPGLVDDARVYNRPLTAEEVATLASGGEISAGAGSEYFDGVIDDVRIYDSVLTPAEM
ncbi:MAG: LamG domain-containing protein, partial [Planctomycetota bacterium]